jgi:hypothetical protein
MKISRNFFAVLVAAFVVVLATVQGEIVSPLF